MCERNVAGLIPYSYSSSYSPELCKKNATALTTLELTPRHGAVRQRPEGLLLLLMPLGHTAAVRIAVLQHSLNPTSEWSSVHWPSVTETAPPALHSAALHWVENRTTALPRLRKTLLPAAPATTEPPSGGRLFPWPSRSQPHSGVKFLLKHLFNFTAACRTGDLQLTSRSWKRVWCLQPYGYGCQKMAAKINCLIRCTFKMTWWWHYQSDKNDNDFIL